MCERQGGVQTGQEAAAGGSEVPRAAHDSSSPGVSALCTAPVRRSEHKTCPTMHRAQAKGQRRSVVRMRELPMTAVERERMLSARLYASCVVPAVHA